MAVVRTVLPRKGFVQPQHGLTGYEQDMDGNMSLADANVAFMSDLGPAGLYIPAAGAGLSLSLGAGFCWANSNLATYAAASLTMAASATNYVYLDPNSSYAPNSNTTGFPPGCSPIAVVVTGASAITSVTDRRTAMLPYPSLNQILPQTLAGLVGINGVVSGFTLSTSGSLTPGLAVGKLFAQGSLYAPAVTPAPGAAPASGTNYLFYNSSSGFYFQPSAVAANTGDALVGQVVTSSSAVTAVTQGAKLFSQISVSPSGSGNFTVQHFLGRAPIGSVIRMTSSVSIYFQTPTDVDATNLYLTASGSGTAKVLVW